MVMMISVTGEAPLAGSIAFNPEIIPGGVYTHLIFAHADIDPESFEVRPHAFDPPLYDRVSLVKRASPSTKIYISLGGKALNGPGVATFSKLARSTGPQIKFARSLLSFLEFFGFDGVEIDWEHPVEEGNVDDFTNFPEWMRKLRLHLAAAGRGLSIAAPLGSCKSDRPLKSVVWPDKLKIATSTLTTSLSRKTLILSICK